MHVLQIFLCKFSMLLTGEFVKSFFLVGDHFLHSLDLSVSFRRDTVGSDIFPE